MRFVVPPLLVLLLVLLPIVALADGGETTNNYRRISMLLFPETVGWTSVDSMKRVDITWLDANRAKLEAAFRANKTSEEVPEGGGCFFVERLFSGDYEEGNGFFQHDVNDDGRMDVIYTGDARCAEGDLTFIWLGTANGYEWRADYLWRCLLLSLKVGADFKIASMDVGCCGDRIDDYRTGSSSGHRTGGLHRITKQTVLPSRNLPGKSFVTAGELVLRESPRIDDAYDADSSGFFDHAVFGNVMTKYLPGCAGIIPGDSAESTRGWSFVVLNEQCGPLRTHAPIEVDAGWVETGQLNLSKQ